MAAKKGFSGAKVVEVQRRLKLLSYEIGDSQIDGIMGPKTKEAVRKFQNPLKTRLRYSATLQLIVLYRQET